MLAALGLRETISFPFLDDQDQARLRLPDAHPLTPSLALKNPLVEQTGKMQTTLVPALVKAVAANRRHGSHGVRLFESGRAYMSGAAAANAAGHPYLSDYYRFGRHVSHRAKGDVNRPVERHLLAGILDQPYAAKAWNTPEVPADVFHGKAVVSRALRALGVDGADFRAIDGAALPFLHPGAAAAVFIGKKFAGFVGELHPATAAAYDLSAQATPVVFELDLEVVFEGKSREKKLTTELMKFPPATRDLAFLANADVTHANFVDAIGRFKRKRHLTHYDLFDVYQGERLPAGKKSMAYSFQFQSPERTLTDQEVEGEVTALIQWLGESLQVTQR
jgi:phenylalanyl-tRNA synthetase beta chain